MGTRAMGDLFSERALPDEPVFELLARDPTFAKYVNAWADEREAAIECGDRPESDRAQVADARACAEKGAIWRRENLYKWRTPPQNPVNLLPEVAERPEMGQFQK